MVTKVIHVDCLPESKRCRRLVQETVELIANKWAVPLILTLSAEPLLRYSDLKSAVTGISAKELAKQLRLLESAGLVGRKVHPSIPPRVEYWLTDLGHSLRPQLDGLAAWAVRHGPQVERNREGFQAKPEQRPEAMEGRTVHRIR